MLYLISIPKRAILIANNFIVYTLEGKFFHVSLPKIKNYIAQNCIY